MATEIEEVYDGLSLQVVLMDVSRAHKIVGKAAVNLWVMIEDSCNILRQEVDIMADDAGGDALVRILGSVVVDVKGWHLLSEFV